MNEQNRLSLIINSLFNFIPLGLAFLMPVFFLATTSEFFEFNKLMLLTLATLLLALAWIFKIVEKKTLSLTKSIIDLPFLVYIATVALSTVFSLNKTISIYGSQGRWFPSLFGTLVMFAFYYLISGNLRNRKAIKATVLALIGGITLTSLVSILSYYNVYIGTAPYFRLSNFSLTGSITTTTILAALGVVVSIASLIYETAAQRKAMLLVSTVVNYFLVAIVSITPAWIVLGVGVVSIVFFISYKNIMENTVFLTMAAGTLAAITLVVFLPTTRDLVTVEGFPREITLPVRESWVVSSEVIQDYPTLATGPSSFGMNFPRYRPLSLNNGDLWNVRFDKPYNEFFNIIATIGVVGLLTAVFLAYKVLQVVFNSVKTHEDDGLAKILGIGALALTPMYLVTYATVLNTFVLVLLVALIVANLGMSKAPGTARAESVTLKLSSIAPVTTIGEEGAIKKEYVHLIFAALMVVPVVYTGYLAVRQYTGEAYLRASIVAANANNGAETFEYQTNAIQVNSRRDAYHNAYAQTNLALANSIASKEELTDADRTTIQQLIAQSIRNSRLTTEVLNPLNVDNWTTRAGIYRSISPIAQNAAEWAIASYNTAIQLSPTDPRLRLDLGGIYYANGDYLTAANFYRQAILLKQDYANAHFNFAQALIRLEDYNNARRSLEITRNLVDVDSNDYRLVEEQLASLPAPQAAGQQLPTVEELEGADQTGDQATPAQEPVTNVGEEEIVNTENLQPQDLPVTNEQPATEGNEGDQQEGQ